MESVRDRLGWIVENCRNPAAHIGMVLRGDIGEPRRHTLTKIAHAAEVSLGWLITGEGSAHPDGPPARAPEAPQRPTSPVVDPATDGTPLERTLGAAFNPSRHLPRDIVAVQKTLGETFQFQGSDEAVNLDKAREWLDAAVREGHGGRHPEASIDRVAMAIWLPRSAVLGALARVGFDPERLLIELPGVSVPWVIVRAAWVAGRSVIVRVGAERWAYAPEGQHGTVAEGPWEREMAQAVLRTGRSQRDLFGGTARPLVVAGRAGVVILPGG